MILSTDVGRLYQHTLATPTKRWIKDEVQKYLAGKSHKASFLSEVWYHVSCSFSLFTPSLTKQKGISSSNDPLFRVAIYLGHFRISTCDRMHGVAGNPDCWTDVFDYHRCCEPGPRGLFIVPSPAKASDA